MTVRLALGILCVVSAAVAQAQDGTHIRTTTANGMELPYEEIAEWSGRRSPGVANAVPVGRRSDGTLCLWPGGIIPYVIDDGTPGREDILRAIRAWDTQTVLRFVERTPQHENWVRFTAGPLPGDSMCRDEGIGETIFQVGPGGKAYVNLLHTLGHKTGQEHEQQRRDRDRYLTVFRENIAATGLARDAWHPRLGFGPDTGVYDYRSTMHYHAIEPQKMRNHTPLVMAETIPPRHAVRRHRRSVSGRRRLRSPNVWPNSQPACHLDQSVRTRNHSGRRANDRAGQL